MEAKHERRPSLFDDALVLIRPDPYDMPLAFEADELHRIVDLMRDLRATGARRHVREEVPFFTGPRVPLAELVAALP